MDRRTIYVTNPRAKVHRHDGMVAVSVDGVLVDRWGPDEVSRVMLFGNVQITTQVLGILMREGAQVCFLSPSGAYRGQVLSAESGNVFVRLAQHARFSNPEFRQALARAYVRVKMHDGRSQIRRFARNHGDPGDFMAAAADRLTESLAAAETATSLDQLRGVEGAAAAVYFAAFDRMVRPPFAFERRSKHPAHNEVNALLNLGYTLLANEIAGRLEAAGFDPRIGYFHGIRYGRSSLALDLIEAHRVSVIDRFTLALLNRRMFAPRDFVVAGDGVRMTPNALRRYLSHYEAAMSDDARGAETARRRIEAQIAHLRHCTMAGVFERPGPSFEIGSEPEAIAEPEPPGVAGS